MVPSEWMRCQFIGLVNLADHAGAVFCWAQTIRGIIHARTRIEHDFLICVGLGVAERGTQNDCFY
jgi:hypothetical protein